MEPYDLVPRTCKNTLRLVGLAVTNVVSSKLNKFSRAKNLGCFNLIKVGSFSPQIVDHSRSIERVCIDTYRSGGKRLFHQYSSISILIRSKDPPSRY